MLAVETRLVDMRGTSKCNSSMQWRSMRQGAVEEGDEEVIDEEEEEKIEGIDILTNSGRFVRGFKVRASVGSWGDGVFRVSGCGEAMHV